MQMIEIIEVPNNEVVDQEKMRKKLHWEKNKEKYNAKRRKSPEYIEKQRQYRETKKEEIKAKNGEKVYCDTCQFHVRRDYLSKHNKTFNHLNPYHGCRIDPEIEEKYPHFAEKLRKDFREKQKIFYAEKENRPIEKE
jgi:hypothetical protein